MSHIFDMFVCLKAFDNMAKYIGKYRLQNISPTKADFKMNHVFSATIMAENEQFVELKVDNILDDRDTNRLGYIYKVSIKDFTHKYQQYLIKIN